MAKKRAVKTAKAGGYREVIDSGEAVKVKVIKKTHFEQIPRFVVKYDGSFAGVISSLPADAVVVGLCEGNVVIRLANGYLVKCPLFDYIVACLGIDEEIKYMEELKRIRPTLPQMFTE